MPLFYNATQVAEQLGISPQYVSVLARRHKIGQKVGKRRVYSNADVRRMGRRVRPRGWPLGRKRKRR